MIWITFLLFYHNTLSALHSRDSFSTAETSLHGPCSDRTHTHRRRSSAAGLPPRLVAHGGGCFSGMFSFTSRMPNAYQLHRINLGTGSLGDIVMQSIHHLLC